MSFGEHLEELRKRIIYALVGVLPIFVTALVFGTSLLEIIRLPADRALRAGGLPPTLMVTGPLEALGAWLRVAIVVTVVLGVPLIFYQLWLFVAPGLYEHEKRFVRFLMPLSVTLSMIGLAFLYFVMLPAMLTFLIGFTAHIGPQKAHQEPLPPGITLPTVPTLHADPTDPAPGAMWYNDDLREFRFNATPAPTPDNPNPAPDIRGVAMTKTVGIVSQYRISEYVGLVFTTSLAFVLGFQTPVVVLLLGWLGIVNQQTLRRSRKYALFFAFALATVLSPSPDPFSMVILALPLYLLYELGLFLLKFFPPARVARGIKFSDLTSAPARQADE
jgi:sec-independent protein translocase protein TatC